MKLAILLGVLLILGGCTASSNVMSISDLALNRQDLSSLGLVSDHLKQLGMDSSTDCKIEEYQTDEFSPLAQSGICSYTLDGSEVIIQLEKYATLEALDGSYQYGSLHLRSADGLLSENDYGDKSRFYVNSPNDYGAEFNPTGVYFYSLYFTKDTYLVHISSKGSIDAKEDVAAIGRTILSKF
ncbi:MAG: hypothetical protein WC471_02285 [Candidatus Woesearchaeota archaeon]